MYMIMYIVVNVIMDMIMCLPLLHWCMPID